MRLILIRHGETAHNAGGFVQGRADQPLTELGRRQAQALAESLRGEPLAAVIASPLRRAYDTAVPIATAAGLGVEVEPDLAEMDVGELEGLSGPQMRARYPQVLAAWAGPDGPALVLPGGESLTQVQARAWPVIERLRAAYDGRAVAVVAHNLVILTLLCRAVGAPLTGFRRFRLANASRSVLDFREDRVLALTINDVCHLNDLAPPA